MSGDDRQVFRRNVSWQIVASFGQMALSALVLVVMARGLNADGLGVFSIIMGLVYVANALFEPRMQDVVAKRLWDLGSREQQAERHDHAIIDLFLIEAIGKLLPLIGLMALAWVLADFSNLPPGSAWLIIIAAAGIYVSKLGFGLAIGLMRVVGRSDIYAYCLTGEAALRLLLLMILYWLSELTVTTSILVLCCTGTLCAIVQWLLVSRYAVDLPRAARAWHSATTFQRLKGDRRLLLSNIGLSMSDLMSKDLDVTLISPLMPAAEVGLYKMGKNIVMLAWKAIDPFYLALMPEINRLASLKDFAAVRSLIAKCTIGLFAVSLTIAVAAYLFVMLFGDVIFGPAFARLPHLLPLMFVGVVISTPLVWGHPLSVALDRADLALMGSVLGACSGMLVFIGLVPIYGIFGASIGWTLTFAVNFIFTSTMALRLLRRHAGTVAKPTQDALDRLDSQS